MEQFTVRCSEEDFEEFKERAHQARQSLNAWAVAMLKGREDAVPTPTKHRPAWMTESVKHVPADAGEMTAEVRRMYAAAERTPLVAALRKEMFGGELTVDRSVTQDPVEIAKQAKIAEARRIQEEAMKREAPKKPKQEDY